MTLRHPPEAHAHSHSGGHSHHHAGHHGHHRHEHGGSMDALNAAFCLGILLNAAFVFVEATFGFISHSLALLADAGHNLGDVFSLALAWMASWASRRPPTARRTYGFGRGTILASLVNAIALLIAVGAIGLEAVLRLSRPAPVDGHTMAVVAGIGIVVNGATALMLWSRSRRDLNVRAAFLHMAADTVLSAAVVAAGFIVVLTGWWWIDSATGVVIAFAIAFSTVAILRESLNLAMDAVPRAVDRDAVSRFLLGHAGVASVHDLHIWSLSTTSIALTAHLVMPGVQVDDEFLHRLSGTLHERYGIDHVTIQVERGDGGIPCKLAPEGVI